MSDFLNKVMTLVLIFIMLVIGPMLLSYSSTDMVAERLILNDVTQFIDKVTDKSIVTDYDINDLYLAVNSHGNSYNVEVARYQLLEEPLPDGSTKLVYIRHDDMEKLVDGEDPDGMVELNIKDVVKVTVTETNITPGKRLFWNILRVDKGTFNFSLAGTVR